MHIKVRYNLDLLNVPFVMKHVLGGNQWLVSLTTLVLS